MTSRSTLRSRSIAPASRASAAALASIHSSSAAWTAPSSRGITVREATTGLKRVRPVAYGLFSEVLQLLLVEVLRHVLDGLVAVTVTRQAEQHARHLAEQRMRGERAAAQQVPERFPALRQREPVQREDSLLVDELKLVPLLDLGVTGRAMRIRAMALLA